MSVTNKTPPLVDNDSTNSSHFKAVIEKFENLSITYAEMKERADLLRLARKKDDLARLRIHLKSSKSYISRSDRELMVLALLFYERRFSVNVAPLVRALQASTKHHIEKDMRIYIAAFIESLLAECTSEFDVISPQNDEERFDSMVEENNITPKVWQDMQEMGIILCNALPSRRKLELVGTESRDAFRAAVVSRWGFEHPFKYFKYTGDASVPVGKIDVVDAYVTAS